ncbi:DUF4352 domain-containing protein [Alicyclobacillus suci]|uniref:DUF4352 domain-containing protein n=1 Tax=Alicyclobacillus suci TaxID=2816080 RepID=UPI001A8E4EBD|nr:DUF4352 domain-containing protein [Alicyclobacillus suci]
MILAKIFGWIFIPYIMLAVRWRKSSLFFRAVGILWSVVILLSTVKVIAADSHNEDLPTSVTTIEQADTNSVSGKATSTVNNKQTKQSHTNSVDSDMQSTTNATTTAQSDLKALESYPHLGQPSKVGNLEITINNVKQFKYVGTDTANGMYWGVSVTVQNDGSNPQTISDSMFKIVSPTDVRGDSNSYSPDVDADIQANETNNFLTETLNPGVSSTGFVIFDMPSKYTNDDMQVFHLVVDTGLLGSKQSFSFLQ